MTEQSHSWSSLLEKARHQYVYTPKHTHSGKEIEMKSRTINKKTVELITVLLYHRELHSHCEEWIEAKTIYPEGFLQDFVEWKRCSKKEFFSKLLLFSGWDYSKWHSYFAHASFSAFYWDNILHSWTVWKDQSAFTIHHHPNLILEIHKFLFIPDQLQKQVGPSSSSYKKAWCLSSNQGDKQWQFSLGCSCLRHKEVGFLVSLVRGIKKSRHCSLYYR